MSFSNLKLLVLALVLGMNLSAHADDFTRVNVQVSATKDAAFGGVSAIGAPFKVLIVFGSKFCAIQFEDKSKLSCYTNTVYLSQAQSTAVILRVADAPVYYQKLGMSSDDINSISSQDRTLLSVDQDLSGHVTNIFNDTVISYVDGSVNFHSAVKPLP